MNGSTPIHRKTGVTNPDTRSLNPHVLLAKDIDAYQVTREYTLHLNAGNTKLCKKIRTANQDLEPYFRFIDNARHGRNVRRKGGRS